MCVIPILRVANFRHFGQKGTHGPQRRRCGIEAPLENLTVGLTTLSDQSAVVG